MATELRTLPVRAVLPLTQARDGAWLRAARQARWLSYVSLGWMLGEGVLGIIAGAQAHSIAVISWAIGSAVEAGAAVIVIVRFSGANRFSETAERRAQKWVAGTFFVLIPYILHESVSKLVAASQPERNWLAVALLASSIVLMPLLGWSKHRLGRRLDSDATAGEGSENLLCAAQGAVGLVGLLAGSAGLGFLDPVAALVIAGMAARDGIELWRGEDCACQARPGLQPAGTGFRDEGCEGC